jgi:hypothetical protein
MKKWIPSSRLQQNKDRLSQNNTLRKEILKEITENFMEMLLEKVNENVQETLKKFQDNKIKE